MGLLYSNVKPRPREAARDYGSFFHNCYWLSYHHRPNRRVAIVYGARISRAGKGETNMNGPTILAGQEGMMSTERTSDLSSLERGLLALPMLAGALFGLLALLAPQALATFAGYSGNDHYIYHIAGAATLGYAVALAFVIRQANWPAARIVVIAVLTFNLASLFACALEITKSRATGGAYLITVASLLFVAICAWLLYSHGWAVKSEPNIAQWVVWLIIVSTASAAIFGLLPILVPSRFAQFFGYNGTDLFIYRQAGAATLGYAVMGIFELRSRDWSQMRWPALMALTFNALGFLASLWSLYKGSSNSVIDPLLLPVIIAVASLGVTIGTVLTLQREGK